MAKLETVPGDPTATKIAEQVQAQRDANAAAIAAAREPVRPDSEAALHTARFIDAFRTQHGPAMQARRAALKAPDLVLDTPGQRRRGDLLDLMTAMEQLFDNIDAIGRAQTRFEHLTLAEVRMGRAAELQQRFRALAETPQALEELWVRFEESWAKFGQHLGPRPGPVLPPDPAPSGPPPSPRRAKGILSGAGDD